MPTSGVHLHACWVCPLLRVSKQPLTLRGSRSPEMSTSRVFQFLVPISSLSWMFPPGFSKGAMLRPMVPPGQPLSAWSLLLFFFFLSFLSHHRVMVSRTALYFLCVSLLSLILELKHSVSATGSDTGA